MKTREQIEKKAEFLERESEKPENIDKKVHLQGMVLALKWVLGK